MKQIIPKDKGLQRQTKIELPLQNYKRHFDRLRKRIILRRLQVNIAITRKRVNATVVLNGTYCLFITGWCFTGFCVKVSHFENVLKLEKYFCFACQGCFRLFFLFNLNECINSILAKTKIKKEAIFFH